MRNDQKGRAPSGAVDTLRIVDCSNREFISGAGGKHRGHSGGTLYIARNLNRNCQEALISQRFLQNFVMKKTSILIFCLLVIVAGGIIFMGLRLPAPRANNPALVAYAILLIFVIALFLFKIRKGTEGAHTENTQRGKRKIPVIIFSVIAGAIFWLACWHYLGQTIGRPY